MNIVLLCGGVGGSKLAVGLYEAFPTDQLTIISNTGDDLRLLGLHISPDIDTVTYALAGLSDPAQGWGIGGDTFAGLDMLAKYGFENWFKLGDRDIATHLVRTSQLATGLTLSEVTDFIRRALNVRASILPMTDDPVSTKVRTNAGWLDFQEYFVKRRHADQPLAVKHTGMESARLPDGVIDAVNNADVIVVAPSNPVVSIGPILAVPGVRELLGAATAPKIAVSPFIGSRSITGPADALMACTGHAPTVNGLARLYRDWLDGLVIDEADSAAHPDLDSIGVRAHATDVTMPDLDAKIRLARFTIAAAN